MDRIFIMSKSRTFLIGAIVLAVAIQCSIGEERRKRQAPNINVHQIPKTSFSCVDRTIGEYYADPEVFCQVYHVCVPGMGNKMSLISFVCPNGTIFSQATRVCTPYDRVDCSLTANFYDSVNGQHDSSIARSSDSSARSVDLPEPPRPNPPRAQQTPAPQPPRFRSNPNQLTSRTTTKAPARQQVTTRAPIPARPAFRQPVTPRTVVSTSTSSYNYEYEYDYEYEDDVPATAGRSKRSTKGFTCEGKLPGAAYADVESDCEMFHICVKLAKGRVLDYKVSCGNDSAYDQETGSCRQKGQFVCENASLFYQFEKQSKPSKKPVINKKKYIPSKVSE